MNENNNVLFERLLLERNRLGISQANLAEKCGVSRNMVGRYERGIAVPGGEFLAAFAKAGADIYYILVGRKENQPQPVMLTTDELSLIDTYRGLDEAAKEMLRLNAERLLAMKISKGQSKTIRKRHDSE